MIDADPLIFQEHQSNPEACIPCDRPDKTRAIPVTLIHPIFGTFVDECSSRIPTVEDMQLATSLIDVLSYVHSSQVSRHKGMRRIFEDADIHFLPAELGPYTTGGEIVVKNFRSSIAQFGDEIGYTGSEPYYQAILYYLESTRAFEHLHSVFPCIFVLIFGPFISFAGAVWTDRPTINMLSPAFPTHFHSTDTNIRDTLARHLGTFRSALRSLQTYYEGLSTVSTIPSCSPMFPYKSDFCEERYSFHYISRVGSVGNSLVFKGEMRSSPHDLVFIKFTCQYSEDLHRYCTSERFAPSLRALEKLPGGWQMVIMDDISAEYVELYDMIDSKDLKPACKTDFTNRLKDALVKLHEKGLVHGDVRNTNIMVKKDDMTLKESFMLVDFDWGGKASEARYPLDLNTTTVKRPEWVFGRRRIEPQHDLTMLQYIWS
ncbi:hypothetical protein CPB83DRAFT_226976 [Crepidotus variabilis]|uniref:Protein kinase domain-containing protein n=1 Tax=Crepidotus variabilis TaxID=179855 RepID=A0A9P6EU25_9AGAR|nr:hypothetical protein CPB83DRAFT_226976 [Crepidotus variabilis]